PVLAASVAARTRRTLPAGTSALPCGSALATALPPPPEEASSTTSPAAAARATTTRIARARERSMVIGRPSAAWSMRWRGAARGELDAVAQRTRRDPADEDQRAPQVGAPGGRAELGAHGRPGSGPRGTRGARPAARGGDARDGEREQPRAPHRLAPSTRRAAASSELARRR